MAGGELHTRASTSVPTPRELTTGPGSTEAVTATGRGHGHCRSGGGDPWLGPPAASSRHPPYGVPAPAGQAQGGTLGLELRHPLHLAGVRGGKGVVRGVERRVLAVQPPDIRPGGAELALFARLRRLELRLRRR